MAKIVFLPIGYCSDTLETVGFAFLLCPNVTYSILTVAYISLKVWGWDWKLTLNLGNSSQLNGLSTKST